MTAEVLRTPRPWPEGVEPTPEQLADWLLVCGPTERLRFATLALDASRDAGRCLASQHDLIEHQVRDLERRYAELLQRDLAQDDQPTNTEGEPE